MAKIARKNMKVFGSSAGVNQIGKFGSLAAGSAATTTDPEVVQALANYLTGWYGAVIGSNSPCIEDLNAICFLYAYQLSYLMQTGIPEWNSETTYYIGSMVNDGLGNIYVSKVNTNLNNALTDVTKWQLPGGNVRTITAADSILITDDLIRVNNTVTSVIVTLPVAATSPIGKEIVIKRLATSLFTVTVKGNGSDLIDDANTYILTQAKGALRVKNSGTIWDVV
jgi:hypothetical protein